MIISSYERKISYLEHKKNKFIKKYLIEKNKYYANKRNHRMAVYANDLIGTEIYLNGIFEKDILELLVNFFTEIGVDEKTLAIDIGANIGNHSLYFSEFFSKVISFEANPHTYKLLEYNASYTPNIETYNIGIGDKEEQLTLYENPNNYGNSSMVIHHKYGLEVLIDIKPLDNILIDSEPIGLIKIDVEGMEYNVLNGAKNIIKNNQPIIVFEQHKSEFLENENETLSTKFLKEQGYMICWVESVKKSFGILEWFFGKVDSKRIVTGKSIPKKFHDTLIAIPTKLQDKIINL